MVVRMGTEQTLTKKASNGIYRRRYLFVYIQFISTQCRSSGSVLVLLAELFLVNRFVIIDLNTYSINACCVTCVCVLCSTAVFVFLD